MCLLFEGSAEGKGQLVITLHKADGTEIGEGPGVWLDLLDVRKMYQSSVDNMLTGTPPGETEQTVVFVHGWNMSPEWSRSFAETMFKRLWHRGYKGRFAYFRWNTDWSSIGQWLPVGGAAIDSYLAEYNNSEYEAWTQAAPDLKTFVQSLPYQTKNIAAHSMGNVVASEALKQGMTVNNYALMQAAVAAAAYDDDEGRIRQTNTDTHYGVTMWDTYTPDDDPDPATRALAYRGCFTNVSGNLISFFLENDYATFAPWEFNNRVKKPPSEFVPNYIYNRSAASGQKLRKYSNLGTTFEYYITNHHEAMAYACTSWGKAAGAWGATRGKIGAWVDLSEEIYQLPNEQRSGFGDEHSGQFNANIQSLKPFYDTLMRRLGLGDPNP
jgi:pimeloyl-ACP methyl ester carboxylesterase